MFVDVGNWYLVQLSIKDCMFIITATENSKGCPLQNLVVIGHTHGLDQAWLLVFEWLSTSFPSVGYSFNSKPKWNSPPRAKATDSIMLYCASTFILCQLHIFFNRHFFTSNIQKGRRSCRFVCYFFHPQFLTFIIHVKIGTPIYK